MIDNNNILNEENENKFQEEMSTVIIDGKIFHKSNIVIDSDMVESDKIKE